MLVLETYCPFFSPLCTVPYGREIQWVKVGWDRVYKVNRHSELFWRERTLKIRIAGLAITFLNLQRRPSHMCSLDSRIASQRSCHHVTFSLVGSLYIGVCARAHSPPTPSCQLGSFWRKWLLIPMLGSRNLMPELKHSFLLFGVQMASG